MSDFSWKWLQEESFRIAKDHGWHDPSKPRSFGDIISLWHSEISEVLEEHRNNKGLSEIYYDKDNPAKPLGILTEIADVLIRIADFCGSNNLDLASAIKLKMAFNETRDYRHGNKAL